MRLFCETISLSCPNLRMGKSELVLGKKVGKSPEMEDKRNLSKWIAEGTFPKSSPRWFLGYSKMGRKVRKTTVFEVKTVVFMVAEEGLEPPTSGL